MERGVGRSRRKNSTRHPESAKEGFSLVEVTIAIGIFAFVIVGIIGLFPTALRMRAESSTETRAVLIAQELFANVRAAPSLNAVVFRDGPALKDENNQAIDLLGGKTVMLGYPTRTSVPYFLWGGDRNVGSPDDAWNDGNMPANAVANNITTLAKISATNLPNTKLYKVDVQIREPASIPLTNSRPITFSTLVYSP